VVAEETLELIQEQVAVVVLTLVKHREQHLVVTVATELLES
jgi:hypothetical protein